MVGNLVRDMLLGSKLGYTSSIKAKVEFNILGAIPFSFTHTLETLHIRESTEDQNSPPMYQVDYVGFLQPANVSRHLEVYALVVPTSADNSFVVGEVDVVDFVLDVNDLPLVRGYFQAVGGGGCLSLSWRQILTST